MQIDFFNEQHKSSSSQNKFGLCDEPAPSTEPAYIDENNEDKWIGIVMNPNEEIIDLYPIDHCVEISRPDGNMASRCDGLIKYMNNLIFVELKSRRVKGGKWLREGLEQIKATFDVFQEMYDTNTYDKIVAYVCNNMKPMANLGHAARLQQFKDETGIIAKGQQLINL